MVVFCDLVSVDVTSIITSECVRLFGPLLGDDEGAPPPLPLDGFLLKPLNRCALSISTKLSGIISIPVHDKPHVGHVDNVPNALLAAF